MLPTNPTTIYQNGQHIENQANSLTTAKETYTLAEVQLLQSELLQKQQQMEERMWADSTLSKFDDILRINYDKSIHEFSEVVIYHTSKLTHALRGAFYTVGDTLIEATGCYACTLQSLFKNSFEIGEGLIGQAAKSKEILYLENLPQQNLSVSSSSGLISAKSVIIVPLIFNDKVYGVIELLFLSSLEEKYKELLNRLSRNVATMLQSIQSNAKTKQLLTDSVFQAEALRSAEEELRQNMEEISAIREDVEAKNGELQSQIAIAQQKTEELRAQEEELRQNMEELVSTQEEMERMNREMQLLLTATDAALFVLEISTDNKILKVNKKFLDQTGYALDDLLYKNYQSIMDKDEWAAYQANFSKLKDGQLVRREVKRRKKNGELVWSDATYCPLMNENGELTKVLKISYDITEKKKQAEAIDNLLKEVQIRAAAADESQFIVELSTDAKLLKCNQKFLKETGYTLEDLEGKDYKMLMDNAEFINYQDTLLQLKEGKLVRKEVKRKKKNGDLVWLDATYCPVFNNLGELTKIFKMSYDITDKKKQAEEINNLLKEVQVMLAAADECLFMVELSVDAKLLKCNQKFLKETGYSHQDLFQKDYKILMDTLEFANYQDTLLQLKQGKIVRKEVKRIKKDGDIVWLDAIYYPVADEQKNLVKIFKLSYDITQKKELENRRW